MATEVGQVELGSVTKWLSGGTPNRAVDHYWSGDIPWISASTLKDAEVSSSDQCVTKEAVSLGSKMAPVNSTLLLVRGSALHNEIRAGLVVKPVCFNQDVKALIPSANVYPKFLTYSILGRQTQLLDLVSSAGNTAGVLDTKLVQAFKIWLPDVNEQRAIVTALSDVDALIAGLEKLIDKKRDLKQAAMQQLLTGQTRLTGFSGEWKYLSLGELCSLKSGTSITSSGISDQGAYRCFGGNGLRGYTPTFTHNGSHALIGRQGALCGNVVGVQGKFFASEHALVVTPRIGVAIEWLTFVLGRMNLNQYSESSAQPGLSAFKLLILEVLTPPSEAEQAAIAEALAFFDAELTALESRLTKTRDLKQGMMQELLTGRTRLV